MTLATRVTLFFSAVLGGALLAFSFVLWAAVDSYLSRQNIERLQAALGTLLAAVEINPHSLEWNARERQITLGSDSAQDQVRWLVVGPEGQAIATSANLAADSVTFRTLLNQVGADGDVEAANGHFIDERGGKWDWTSRRLRAGNTHDKPSGALRNQGNAANKDERDTNFSELTMKVALSLEPSEQVSQKLLLSALILSSLLWLFASFVGKKMCGRALRPLVEMSNTTTQIHEGELARRLPVPNTKDELSELALSFNHLLGRVEDAFDRQRRFTAEASHQLRTPLSAMLGQVEVALKNSRSGDEYRSTLRNVQGEGRRLARVVEALLLLARSDSERGTIELEELELNSWLESQRDRWAINELGREMTLATLGTPLRVFSHPPLLGQLLDNLVDNAWKYSPPGSDIVLRVLRIGQRGAIEIADNGIGISTQDQKQLFEPFFRSESVRLKGIPGDGLGLSVVRRIARVLAVSIEVQSVLHKGATFRIVFAEMRQLPVSQLPPSPSQPIDLDVPNPGSHD
jgi:heavy metal sensor kinase